MWKVVTSVGPHAMATDIPDIDDDSTESLDRYEGDEETEGSIEAALENLQDK